MPVTALQSSPPDRWDSFGLPGELARRAPPAPDNATDTLLLVTRWQDPREQVRRERPLVPLISRRLLLGRRGRPRARRLPKWRLRKVQAHIEDNLAKSIRLADLAKVAGLSRMHFAAQFRAATGYRPHEYLLWRRIEAAKAMLRRAELPVVQVALEAGFQTQAHFTTVFKRLTGDTPAAWRRAHRQGPAAS